MVDFSKILLQYWGHKAFRPLQEEVVRSAYEGRDTLALLPTGGGKSVCFQVPAMAKEGICLVVTPLIALMKDQVETLNRKGIKAVAVYSGLSNQEIDVALDNCVYGDYKFLYLSPERLVTDMFRQRVQHMNVNLLAIDEAHCISQWGYDFRPSYMRIAELRALLPGVPVLALTATATPEVAQDIMERLAFRQKNLLQKSFERKNLAYVVRHTEDKDRELLKILRSIPGTSIVYVRTRKATRDVARFLLANDVSADFYSAELSNEERNRKQDDWKSGRTRVVVATNAFGMGIDKPDVRSVVHMEMPDSIEAYYQEAGRGGRDEQKAYAVLLYNESDKLSLQRRTETSFPPVEEIKRIYQALCTYLQIPIGAGRDTGYDFDLAKFCKRYALSPFYTYSALQFLQRDGYLEFPEDVHLPARAMVLVDREELYKIQLSNPDLNLVVKAMLRAYGGIFSQYVSIDEDLISRATQLSPDVVYESLKQLARQKVISYMPRKTTPLIFFTEERLDDKNLRISRENYADRKQRYVQRTKAMLSYASGTTLCRSRQLLAYFGEVNSPRCRQCDVCLERRQDMSQAEFDQIADAIKTQLAPREQSIDELINALEVSSDRALEVVRWLQDNGKIIQGKDGLLTNG